MSFKEKFDEIMKVDRAKNSSLILGKKHPDYQWEERQKIISAAEDTYVTKFMSIATCEKQDRIINNLHKNNLFGAVAESFNDVFDTQIQITKSKIEHLSKTQKISEAEIEEKIKHFNNEYRVLSLSLLDPIQSTSSHMWGLYAESGNGIAIKYNLKEVINNLCNNSDDAYYEYMRMDYMEGDSLYNHFKNDVSLACIQYIETYNPLERFKAFLHDNYAETNVEYAIYKHPQWKNETELRVILSLYNARTYRTENLRKFYDLKCFFPMPKPKEIFIGWKVEECVSKLLLNTIDQSATKIYKLTGKMVYSGKEIRYETMKLKPA